MCNHDFVVGIMLGIALQTGICIFLVVTSYFVVTRSKPNVRR